MTRSTALMPAIDAGLGVTAWRPPLAASFYSEHTCFYSVVVVLPRPPVESRDQVYKASGCRGADVGPLFERAYGNRLVPQLPSPPTPSA